MGFSLLFFNLNLKNKQKKEEKTIRTEHTIKKQKIVKELAVNILELNNYKTRTEQLDNELKNCMKANEPANALVSHQRGCNQDWISQKSETIQIELSKLKSG